MRFNEPFEKLVNSPEWHNKFIGYGNPDAKILIIGQEAGVLPGSDEWKNFYQPNQEQWKETINDENLTYRNGFEKQENEEYKFPEYFNPLFPFYKQLNIERKISKKDKHLISGENGTSQTYWWYQKLLDKVYPNPGGEPEYIDFFRNVFITELNDETREDHTTKQSNLRQNIARRFDMMIATTEFWKRFKVVVFACGPYADAINIEKARAMDENSKTRVQIEKLFFDIFGHNVKPFYCYQLNTRNGAGRIVEDLGPRIKAAIEE